MLSSVKPSKSKLINVCETSTSFVGLDVKWIPNSSRIVVCGTNQQGQGRIGVYKLDTDLKIKLVHEISKPSSLRCCTFDASNSYQRHLATGDFDGGLNVHDLEAPHLSLYSVPNAHREIINCISGVGFESIEAAANNRNSSLGAGHRAPELVTGSSDGHVKVWDIRQKDTPVSSFHYTHDCWSVCTSSNIPDVGNVGGTQSNTSKFGSELNVGLGREAGKGYSILAGFSDGMVHEYDIRTNKLIYKLKSTHGVTSLDLRSIKIDTATSPSPVISVSTTDGFGIYNYNNSSGAASRYVKRASRILKHTVWGGKFSVCNGSGFNDCLVTVDGVGRISCFDINQHDIIKADSIQKHVHPVTSMHWSPDRNGLLACTSFDETLSVLGVTQI